MRLFWDETKPLNTALSNPADPNVPFATTDTTKVSNNYTCLEKYANMHLRAFEKNGRTYLQMIF